MDSLTQIALGAAVGEALLGRKMGNRAIWWGAIGGTIPDLDVTANAFLNEVDALAFHRSITHSFLFTAIFPIPLALGLQWLYNGAIYHLKRYREVSWWVATFVLLLLFLAPTLIQLRMGQSPGWLWYVIPLGITAVLSALSRKYYVHQDPPKIRLSFLEAYGLFFLVFLTHILLDASTTYGTQLLIPFSRERISWDIISVVDPVYTLPLIISLIALMFLARQNTWRQVWNWIGLGLSTAYIAVCTLNHARVMDIARHSLEQRGIDYERLKATPTLANNFLWNVLADTGDKVYVGSYSFLDSKPVITDFEAVDKGLHYLTEEWTGRTTNVLRWFSNGYFEVRPVEDGLRYHDLRFGVRLEGFDRQAFGFKLMRDDGEVLLKEERDTDINMRDYLQAYWNRIKGRDVQATHYAPEQH